MSGALEKTSNNPDDYTDEELLDLKELQMNGGIGMGNQHWEVLGKAGGRLNEIHKRVPSVTPVVGEMIDIHQGNGNNKTTITVPIPRDFRKTNFYSERQPVYTNGKVFISPDITGHKAGVWKMAKTYEGLFSKETRMGTYDRNLNKIDD